MIRRHIYRFIWMIIIGISLAGIAGCATVEPTKPNRPYQGSYPTSIDELRQKNPLLVAELGKLPDIKDGITDAEAKALDQLVFTYRVDAAAFDNAFNIMYQVGNPKVRRYCTLLEAYFWYALEYDTEQMLVYLTNYDGIRIDKEYPFLKMFTVNWLLAVPWNFENEGRWKNPKTVMERLNAPEFVEYWLATQFIYNRGSPKPPPIFGQSASTTIKTRKGVCYDAANLARECLLAGGYKATGLNVLMPPGGRVRGHSVGVLEIETSEGPRLFKIADTRFPGVVGPIPYTSYKSMAEDIAREYGRIIERYTVGLPGFTR